MRANIAVFFGGRSSEYEVSLQSAYAVLKNLPQEKYRAVPVGITREGEWFYYRGAVERIRDDAWQRPEDCVPALLSPNPGTRGLMLLPEEGARTIPLDAAMPVLHGRNGEDGTIQGMIELAGIPLAGCGTLSSALCMDKDRAHRLAAAAGIAVPRGMTLNRPSGAPEGASPDAFPEQSALRELIRDVGFPLFVKPVRAGSSFGITRVTEGGALAEALRLAFRYDDRVILEEAVPGFEVGCAVLGNPDEGRDTLITGEADEIELSGGFFDFTEKYTLKTSSIHVPARINRLTAHRIKESAKTIYQALDCAVFARVDMFLTPDGRIVFNEVNTIPGFTEHSRYPKMMEAAGYSFREVLDRILVLAMRR